MPGNDAQCCARRCGGLLVSVPAFSPTIPGSNLGAPPQCGLPPLRSYCTNNLKPPRPRWAVKKVLRSCLPFGGSESVRFSGSGSVRYVLAALVPGPTPAKIKNKCSKMYFNSVPS